MSNESLKEGLLLTPAFEALQRSLADTRYNGLVTAASSTGIDTRDYDQCIIEFNLGTIASTGTLDVAVYESSVSTTSAGSNFLTGASFAQKSNGDNGLLIGQIDCKNTKRYIYVQAIAAVATAKEYGINVLLGKYDGLSPVTQDNTVAFTVSNGV